jgi:hypothetical protein
MASAEKEQELGTYITGTRDRKMPEIFSISNFISKVNQTSLAKSNKFVVEFGVPSGVLFTPQRGDVADLTYFCESVEFPGRSFATSDMRLYGPTFKSPTMSSYSEVNLTLLCDADLMQKRTFDTWMDYINPKSSFDFNYREDYVTDVIISQLDDAGTISYSSILRECYPLSVNSLTGNWADDNFHRLQVSLTYRYWDTV